jgi:pimeloyl-ACP methyl ester carboxylesterase
MTRLGVFLSLLAVVSCGSEMRMAEDTLQPVSRMVDAGGHRLVMEFWGTGDPAVVFDAGMIGGMQNWAPVRDEVSQHSQTIVFERAGFGDSEVGPDPRDARQLSTELHTALENAGIAFPVVLVGHSAGGLFSRVFAYTYPDDVAGLVLVDPAVEDVYDYMRDSDPERWANYADEVGELYDPPPGWFGQWEALQQSLRQARDSWPLPAVPTVVLSAGSPAGEWPIQTEQDMAVWAEAQESLVEQIPGVEHLVFPAANHASLLSEPTLPEKIIETVARGRAGSHF